MDSIEAATLITLKAMETSGLVFKTKSQAIAATEEANAFNAEQIAKFYETIYTEIKEHI